MATSTLTATQAGTLRTKEQLLAGNCHFTIEPPAEWAARPGRKEHYTYKCCRSKDGRVFFVSHMTGSDNESDYEYLGIIPADGPTEVRWTGSSRFDRDSLPVVLVQKVVAAIAQGRVGAILDAGWNVHHEERCCRCGRRLTNPASCQTGIGPECESLHRLGVRSWDDIPTRIDRHAARLQYLYWTLGDKTALVALHDAVLDMPNINSYQAQERLAEDLVFATRKAARKFRHGKNLDRDWIRWATGPVHAA